MLGIATAHRNAPPRNVGLTAWLLQHHLTNGLAPYWEASSITVDSGGVITVVSVNDGGWHGHVSPQDWETDVQLGAPAPDRTASFVVLSPAEKVRRSSVLATFGKPARSYRYGPFTILVWHKNLLPQMALAAKPAAHADGQRHQARRQAAVPCDRPKHSLTVPGAHRLARLRPDKRSLASMNKRQKGAANAPPWRLPGPRRSFI